MKYLISRVLKITFFISFVTANFASAQFIDKSYEGDKISHLLIIALVEKIDNRKTLEDELKYTFSDYGVKVLPSHKSGLRTTKKLTKEAVLEVCKKKNIDGVLVIKIVDSKQENGYSYNQRTMYTGGGTASATSTGVVVGSQGSYSWGQYAYGNYFDTVSSTKVEVQSDIHRILDGHEDAKILFANDMNMRVSDPEEGIGKFAKKLTKKIMKKKLIEVSEN